MPHWSKNSVVAEHEQCKKETRTIQELHLKNTEMEEFIVEFVGKFMLLKKSKEELVAYILELQQKNEAFNDKVLQLQKEMLVKEQKHKSCMDEFEDRYTLIKEERDKYLRIANLKLGESYNINASWIDKIVFVLKEAKRPLRSSEIIQILNNNDYVFREAMQDKVKTLSHYIARALKYGRIYGEKQAGMNGYLLSLPEE